MADMTDLMSVEEEMTGMSGSLEAKGLSEIANTLRFRYDDPDMWWGMLCAFTIPVDTSIDLMDWIDLVHGTDVADLIPSAPRTVNGFKRAVGAAGGNRIRLADRVWQFMPRSAGHDVEYVFKNVTLEELDSEGHVLSYYTAIEFVYSRINADITTIKVNEQLLEEVPQEVADEIQRRIDLVKAAFNRMSTTIDSAKIARVIRDDIERNLLGCSYGNGRGLYFVFPKHHDRILALSDLVNALPGCSFLVIPLINDDYQKENLRLAFEGQVKGAAIELSTRISEAIEKGGVSSTKLAKLQSEYFEIIGRLKEYGSYLDDGMDSVQAHMAVLGTQVEFLYAKSMK